MYKEIKKKISTDYCMYLRQKMWGNTGSLMSNIGLFALCPEVDGVDIVIF
jgi:hypothetical protein